MRVGRGLDDGYGGFGSLGRVLVGVTIQSALRLAEVSVSLTRTVESVWVIKRR